MNRRLKHIFVYSGNANEPTTANEREGVLVLTVLFMLIKSNLRRT